MAKQVFPLYFDEPPNISMQRFSLNIGFSRSKEIPIHSKMRPGNKILSSMFSLIIAKPFSITQKS